MKLEITYVANIDDNRVDAEISFKHWYKKHWDLAAIVYKSGNEYVVEYYGSSEKLRGISESVEKAKKGLLEYINSTGADIQEGSTRAGHALELMLKKDGTSMGVKFEVE